ncbi:MAG: MFS transporter [Lachnospiraceae bacterium]|nr:MFS transporter [Lachnospiraceae bacterium]
MKLNYKRTFLIGLAFLSISSFWQMYDNIIPLILKNTFGLGETVTGVIMAMDNVLALFLLPILGAFSDRTETKIGKRMPFILTGTGLAFIFMLVLPYADNTLNLPMFVIALFALLVAMGLYRSPAVALMPDLTPNRLRSKANAIINLMGAVGAAYALVMIMVLVSKEGKPDYFPMFLSIALLMLISILICFITVPENKTKEKVAEECRIAGETFTAETEEEEQARLNGEVKGAKLEPAVKRSMIFLLASIFLWYFAYNAVTTAFSRYTIEVWGMENSGFAGCLMIAMIAAIISYIPIGHISSKIGRKKTILCGVTMMSVCYFLAIFATTFTPLINVAFAIIGIGWAAINVNSYPMVVEMAKGGDIGKYTGTYYTFSMAAQIITPVVSGFLLEHVSYRTLFPYAVVFSCCAFLTMLQVHHGDIIPDKKG